MKDLMRQNDIFETRRQLRLALRMGRRQREEDKRKALAADLEAM